MILETPTFEKPKEVWGKEIQVLQRLVATETDGSYSFTNGEEKELADSVKDVLKLAGGSTANKTPRISKTTARGRKTSSRRKEADQESEDDY